MPSLRACVQVALCFVQHSASCAPAEKDFTQDILVLTQPVKEAFMLVAIPIRESSSGHYLHSESGLDQLEEVWNSLFLGIELLVPPEVAKKVDADFARTFNAGPPLGDAVAVLTKLAKCLGSMNPNLRLAPQISLGRYGVTRFTPELIVQTPAKGIAIRAGSRISDNEWETFTHHCAKRLAGGTSKFANTGAAMTNEFWNQILPSQLSASGGKVAMVYYEPTLGMVVYRWKTRQVEPPNPSDLTHGLCNLLIPPDDTVGVFIERPPDVRKPKK